MTWHNQDPNPGHSDPEAKCLPLDHNATIFRISFYDLHDSTVCFAPEVLLLRRGHLVFLHYIKCVSGLRSANFLLILDICRFYNKSSNSNNNNNNNKNDSNNINNNQNNNNYNNNGDKIIVIIIIVAVKIIIILRLIII